MQLQMKMPDLATTGSEIKLLRWLVQPGEAVVRGQPLLEVETDKAISQVECIATGVLKEVRALPNALIAAGQLIAVLEAAPASSSVPQAISQALRVSSSLHVTQTQTAPANAANSAEQIEIPIGVATAPKDYKPPYLLSLYERMLLIREFEERVKFLFLEGTMPGTIHQCQGQEATAVGVCLALRPDDWITSTFRGHGHALAKGLTPEEVIDELFGATTGCCKGKGGSMHLGNMDKGMLPGIAIVGGGIPLATGMALAFKMQKSPRVVACFFGDGAVAEGAFHEALNMAALWRLPAIFVCENNLYGASTHISKVMNNTRISDRGTAYGLRGETIDGNDVLAVLEATQRAAADCRAGNGPVLLELLTYRRTGHSRRDPCHYQPANERDKWFNRDPLDRFAAWLTQDMALSPADLTGIRARVAAQIDEAVEKAKRAPLPTMNDLCSNVFA